MEKDSPTERKIRVMPDLLVVNEKGEADFIEIKCGNEIEKHDYFKEWLQKAVKYWPEAKILLVEPREPHFRISTILDYAKTGKLYPLERDKFIRVDRELILAYSELIKKYLK